MRKKCVIVLIIIVAGFFIISNFPVTYANADSVVELRSDLTSVQEQVAGVYKYTNFIDKYLIEIIMAILGFFGISVWGVMKYVKKRFEKEIDKAIYKIDPTYLSIKIPSSDFNHESERLKRLGFRNITTYPSLDDSCISGCVIYKVDNTAEAEVLKTFMLDKKVDQYRVGYVLYTRSRIDHDLFKEFNNITFANSPLTLVNAVYAVARGTIK